MCDDRKGKYEHPPGTLVKVVTTYVTVVESGDILYGTNGALGTVLATSYDVRFVWLHKEQKFCKVGYAYLRKV